MTFDLVTLSRAQFALTVMFHYLFPPLTIGLGALMVVMEGLFLKTRDPLYETMARFWTRIFAVNFALGVATGVVMEFQFGSNWATYSRFVGDVFGSALAAEGIFAFFLESGFLAVLVFGWDKVSPRMHFFSTVMVALGSVFSAIWIIVANSWQQTPAGCHLVDRAGATRAEITSFWAVVFNPSTVPRLVHVLIGAVILGAFVVMSVSAFYLLKGRHVDFARRSFGIALVAGAAASVAALFSGDWQARVVSVHQPAKLAVFEGLFTTTAGPTAMYVLGIPDAEARTVHLGLAIPGLLSFLVHRDFRTPVAGLDQIPERDWPPAVIPFESYHLMIGLGSLFVVLTLYALWLWRKNILFTKRWILWVFVFAVAGPFAANQAGWVAAEVGRQPWVVYGLLRTQDAASKAVTAGQVGGSIALFSLIYVLLFAVWVFVLDYKIRGGPEEETGPGPAPGGFLERAGRARTEPGASLTAADGDEQEG